MALKEPIKEAIIYIAEAGKCQIQEKQEAREWSQRLASLLRHNEPCLIGVNPTWKEKESTITKCKNIKTIRSKLPCKWCFKSINFSTKYHIPHSTSLQTPNHILLINNKSTFISFRTIQSRCHINTQGSSVHREILLQQSTYHLCKRSRDLKVQSTSYELITAAEVADPRLTHA